MTRNAQSNYSASGEGFDYCDADTDAFDAADIQKLAKAVANHDHASTKGAACARVSATSEVAIALGTITSDASLIDGAATWNAAGVTFTAIKANIDNVASAAASMLLDLQMGGTTVFNVTKGGILFINDSANTNMTIGLTINQGGNDNDILTFKSSDVAHGITDEAETDTYASFGKHAAPDGGVSIEGLTEQATGVFLKAAYTVDDATKSTAGVAGIMLQASKKSGTTVGLAGADANLVTIRNNDQTEFIFDAEGDSHENGTGWTAYDEHDDLALLEQVNAVLVRAKDPIKAEFWAWVGENAGKLQELKLITFNDDGHHFVNRSKMQELLVGAVRQMGQRLALAERRLELTGGQAGI